MKISIVIPVRNGGSAFPRCLEAVQRARVECAAVAQTELIVVDDGSTDDSPDRAGTAGAQVIATSGGCGPAAARNLGARAATGDLTFFVDADVALHSDALHCAARAFQNDPELEACFGSYDDAPAAPNFLSQYKNLFHHYVHQHARPEASTFWTGCGAMRLSTFHALGGFDEHTYRRPSIEDIDLGYRLQRRAQRALSGDGKILLLKDMQCVHLKHWTARSLLQSDIFERGIPWTVLLWREAQARRAREAGVAHPVLGRRAYQLDLNLQTSNRVCVALAGLLMLSLCSLFFAPSLWPLSIAFAGALLILNRPLYLFFLRKRGAWFTLAAILWHWLYYLYNSLSFILGTLHYFLRGAHSGSVAADGTLASPKPDA